jgi:hypothetical protein
MDFENINDKMIAAIKELYMGFFYKALKMFQVITVGYNASKYKSLQVFREYGWKIHREQNDGRNMGFLFTYSPIKNVTVAFYMNKRLKDGALFIDSEQNRGYVKVFDIREKDQMYKTIKEFEKMYGGKSWMIYGNDKLRYSFEREFDEYKLYFSYPIE